MKAPILVGVLLAVAFAGCIAGTDLDPAAGDEGTNNYVPRVIIGFPDTGINPYHEMYYRPHLTEEPCTYIEGFPCGLPAINLTLGGDDYETMFEADIAVWESIEEDTWYWIPQTVFVAVYCQSGQNADHRGEYCILDDGHMHGTGVTSSALMENPDALLAFKAGGSGIGPFFSGEIPVDVFSISWGTIAPIPVSLGRDAAPLYVLAAGNDPRPTMVDGWAGNPRNIVVGGAYAEDQSQEVLAGNHADVVSYYCRPTAQTRSADELRGSYCGTSFAAPTVAGALSKVIYAIRNETGYTGGIVNDTIDPIAGITVADLRDAMNRTASYSPEAQYSNTGRPIPLNPVAPWTQWGWGFYDGLVADATIDHLMGIQEAPDKPSDAHTWMDTVGTIKRLLHG